MAVVIFDPDEFMAINPQFAPGSAFTDAQLQFAFDVACLLVDNSERSAVPYNPPVACARKTILYLLVCHMCELALRGGGVVGTMTGATEGSVSAAFAAPQNPNGQWFDQTQHGATAWRLLSGFSLGGWLCNG